MIVIQYILQRAGFTWLQTLIQRTLISRHEYSTKRLSFFHRRLLSDLKTDVLFKQQTDPCQLH